MIGFWVKTVRILISIFGFICILLIIGGLIGIFNEMSKETELLQNQIFFINIGIVIIGFIGGLCVGVYGILYYITELLEQIRDKN